MPGEEDLREKLFIAQYHEMWEWKRHHTRLCWELFAGTLVVIGVISRSGNNAWLLIPLVFFGVAMGILFLRHNCFQRAASYVIDCLECDKSPITTHSLTSGQALSKFCESRTYKIRWRWLLHPSTARISWFLAATSISAYALVEYLT